MAQKVISFRCDDDMLTELEQRKLPDESIMLTAQRVLREALGLGVIGEQARRVEEIVDTAVQPIQQEIEELRARLESIEESLKSSDLEEKLNKLGDAYNETVPNLKTDIWLLRQAVFEAPDQLVNRVKQLEESLSELRTHLGGLKKAEASSEDDSTSDTPKFKCSNCGAVGLVGQKFKPAGSSKGKKRHLCLSCGEKITNLIEVK
jgi:chromosome segregation ATPase